MTRIDDHRIHRTRRNLFTQHPVVAYALLAFALAVGHAWAQGFTWEDPTDADRAFAAMTSVFTPGPSSSMSANPVERYGMTANGLVSDPMSVGMSADILEQPLLLHGNEWGSYAVSRKIDYSLSHVQTPLSI